MNNSFYGGRDGRPMVIKKKYLTVNSMIEEFKDPENIEVNFGEYAIIETANRNNPENGRIFRRGTDYQNLTNKYVDSWILNTETNLFELQSIGAYGAIFVSQVVGPSGNAPHLHLLSTKSDVIEQYQDYNNKPGYDVKIGEQDSEASVHLQNLVPGKNEDGTFNDKISWNYCSVRDENQQETNAYVGFEIPYTVIEFQANSVDPYFNRTDKDNPQINFINDPLAEGRTDDGQHPFYEKWKINIPKGIHGESIENIQVGIAAEDIYVFDFTDKNTADSRDENGKLKVKAYNGRDDDIINSRQVLYCTIVDYDRIPEGDKYKIYLGDYNIIDNISLADDGTFIIEYSHNDDYKKEKTDEKDERLTWITGASLDVDNGHLDIETNNEKNEIHTDLTWVKELSIDDNGVLNTITTTGQNQIENQQLQWVKDIEISTDGTVDIIYVDDTEEKVHRTTKDNLIQWVTNVTLNPENGDFKLDYNNGTASVEKSLQWVKNIDFNEEGTVTINYTNQESKEYANLIDWIKSINIAQDGTVTVISNNGTELLAADQPQLKWSTNIKVNEDGTITTEYNNGDPQTQGPTMDWIKTATLDEQKNLNIDYVNAEDISVSLKTVNNINLENGSFFATYNTGETAQIGSVDNATVNMIAGDETTTDTSNLRNGGIFFIIEE